MCRTKLPHVFAADVEGGNEPGDVADPSEKKPSNGQRVIIVRWQYSAIFFIIANTLQ